MICVSIAERTVEECIQALQGLKLAEVRLDAIANIDAEGIRRIFSIPGKKIATCRPGSRSNEGRKALLLEAILGGAAYVDIEVEMPDEYKKEIVKAARGRDCRVIVSYHNYDRTPPARELEQTLEWCFESGADIAKIACRVNNERENARLLGLLDSDRKIIAIGMGERGRMTRMIGPLLGSPFTYACLANKKTADGQLDVVTTKRIVKMLNEERK